MIDENGRSQALAAARTKLKEEKGATLAEGEAASDDKTGDACKDPAERIKELYKKLDSRLERYTQLLGEVCGGMAAGAGGEVDDSDLVWIHSQVQSEIMDRVDEIESIVIDESYACGPRNATPVPWETSMAAEETLRRKYQAARNTALQEYRAKQNAAAAAEEPEDEQKKIPWQIKESLKQFMTDHPDTGRNVLIAGVSGMGAVQAVRAALARKGIAGMFADDKPYHSDEHWNLVTYLHGCGGCVAVFEKMEDAEPPAAMPSFAAGYMEALGGRVCILVAEGREVAGIESIGGPGFEFKQENPAETIPGKLGQWLAEKEQSPENS